MRDFLLFILTFGTLAVLSIFVWAILDLRTRNKQRREDGTFQREVDALLKEEK